MCIICDVTGSESCEREKKILTSVKAANEMPLYSRYLEEEECLLDGVPWYWMYFASWGYFLKDLTSSVEV